MEQYLKDQLTAIESIADSLETISESYATSTGDGRTARFSDYADIATMISTIGSASMTVLGDTTFTLAANTTFPSTLHVVMLREGMIVKASTYTLTINGPFSCGNFQCFSGFDAGDVTGLTESRPEWFGTGYAALSGALASLSAGGRMLIDTAFTSTDELTSSTANITIEFGPNGSITMGAADKDCFNLSGNYATIMNARLTGYGTFVTSGSSGAALIRLTGDYVKVEHATLTNPEQTGLYCSGDHPTINDITVIGGPYFADAAAIGSDRQHYGVWFVGVDDAHIGKVRVIPNGTAGVCIEGFNSSSGSGLITNSDIADIYAHDCWDHGVYAVVEGCTLRGIKTEGCGVKLAMRAWGTATKGNVLSDVYVDVGNLTGPLKGDTGLLLENWCWSSGGNYIIRNAADAGMMLTTTASTDKITGNTLGVINIDTVSDGNGSHSIGLEADTTEEFSYNTIGPLNVRTIGNDTDGSQMCVYIHPADTTAHVENIFLGGVLYNSQEYGASLNYLTNSAFRGFRITGNGAGGAAPALYANDCNYCKFTDNAMIGTASQMTYGYEEASSDNNEVSHNTILNAATQGVRTATKGASTVIAYNTGFVTENHGTAASVSTSGTIAHGLSGTPTSWTVYATDGTALGSTVDGTNITVTFAGGGTKTVNWTANY